MELSTQETLQLMGLLKGAAAGDRSSMLGFMTGMQKAVTQSTGFVWYDLKPGIAILAPLITPLLEQMPRVPGGGDTATRWKALTNFNSTLQDDSVEEGKRSGETTLTEVDYIAPYITGGLEQSVTFQAQWAGMKLDDIRAKAGLALLMAVRQSEERKLLGSNATIALGTPVTGTLVDTTANSGSINAATDVFVACVALTPDGLRRASVSGGIVQQIVRNNNSGDTTTINGGTSKVSATNDVTTANDANNHHTVGASVTAIQGAAGYAWFWGASYNGATLGAITTVNSVIIKTATGAGIQTVTSLTNTDYSKNALSYDGLLSTFMGVGPQTNPVVTASGSVISANPTASLVTGIGNASGLTSDGAGGIVEIDADLLTFYVNSKLGPDEIYVNANMLVPITKAVITAGASASLRFNIDVEGVKDVMANRVTGGFVVGNYINKYTGQNIRVRVHPDMPGGTIMYVSWRIPYQFAQLENIHQIKLRQDYWQISWPLINLKWTQGVYWDGVYQNYFPPAFGVRYNVNPVLN